MTTNYTQSTRNGLNPTQQLYKIVEDGMCIGCGICESIAGAHNISLEVVSNGFERPIIHDKLSEQHIDAIWASCPGATVQGLPKKLVDNDTPKDLVWGPWREMYYAYSAEPHIRHLASTGGVLTALALYLLESKSVSFILHAKASETHPTFGEPTISRTREDVLAAAGSRYGPTATLRAIGEVLYGAQSSNEKFAFIGTPCDVGTLRNYAKLDPRVDQYCDAMLTMVCGGFMSPAGLSAVFEQNGIEPKQVRAVRYRGNGCPGPTSVTMLDGKVTEISYLDLWGEDDAAWQLPPRCKVCPDGIGEAADIAASDVWEGGAPTQQEIDNDPGSNGAIVRSERGKEIMNAAIKTGYLVRGNDITPEDMNRFQPHQEAKKRSVWARYKGMKQAGKLVPDTKRLRLKKLAKQNTAEINDAQTAGSKLRAERGKFSEATPVAIKRT
jgi:coenzyme F420 hydrogenase subunit beta